MRRRRRRTENRGRLVLQALRLPGQEHVLVGQWVGIQRPAAPRDLPIRRDLATRLATGLTYRVLPLTDGEKRTALAAHARTRGFALSGDVTAYLLTHARRDMGSLMAALDTLDRYSMETGRPITVPLLKAAMQ